MIIDHVDKLGLGDERVKQYFNELRSLGYLAKGLSFLNDQVQKIEAEVRGRLNKDRKVFMFGNAPPLQGIPQELVACAFHWYSVSACNYVKLVGWLVNGGDTAKATEYLKLVLPEVYVWRNKMGSHFARTSARKEDTPADLAKSVMFPISFDDNAFYGSSLVLAMTSGGQGSSSRKDMRWSLTHTHQKLALRYWPNSGSGT
jgi:hypothetical protein